jgi:hypothetical protein
MALTYQAKDLLYNHYTWKTDRREEPGAGDLDTSLLDPLEGFEVLLFATTFLDLYLPEHTVDDLHSLEFIFLHHLPPYLRAKNHIAVWLAKRSYFIQFTKNIKLYHQEMRNKR